MTTPTGTPRRTRSRLPFARRALLAAAMLAGIVTATSAASAAAPTFPGAVFAPRGHGRHPAVLFVHGGAWSRSTPTPAELAFARALSRRTGWVVGVATYGVAQPRRLTEPAAVDAALRALLRRHDVDPRAVVLWGESAGAQLALLEAYRHPSFGRARVRAVVSVSGPTDLLSEYGSGGELFLDAIQQFEQASPVTTLLDDDPRYRDTSPAFLVSAASPPTFQAIAAADDLVPVSQTTELDRALTAAGVAHDTVVVAGSDHATPVETEPVPGRGESVESLAVDFVRAQLRA